MNVEKLDRLDKIKATRIDFTVPAPASFFLMYMDVIEAKHFSGVCLSWCEQDHPNHHLIRGENQLVSYFAMAGNVPKQKLVNNLKRLSLND